MKLWAPQKLYSCQPDAVLEQANPVIGTRYVVLPATPNVRLLGISTSLQWTTQPTHLQVYVTLCNKTIIFVKENPVDGKVYYAELQENKASYEQLLGSISRLPFRPFMLEDRSVLVDVVRLGGAASFLQCRVKYASC